MSAATPHISIPGVARRARRRKYKNELVWACLDCGLERTTKPEGRACLCGAIDTYQKFDSRREWRYWKELRILERAGNIHNLKCQVPLTILLRNGAGDEIPVGKYYADFEFYRDGDRHLIDVKGHDTPLSRFKRRCVAALYGIEVAVEK